MATVTLLWGGVLAAGLLLIAAPWMWPAGRPRVETGDTGALTRLAQEAGLPALRARVIVTVCVVGAVLGGATVWLLVRVPVLALAGALAIGAAPVLWLRRRRLTLAASRRGLWPDVCDHLVSAVRAGLSLPDAVASLAESAPAALRPAFGLFARDLDASGNFDASVLRLKDALADPVADRIIETLRMARQVGGTELTAVLRSLSSAVRAEAALRGEVDARQSWIRGAAVLGVVAPWVIVALLSLRPEGVRAYTSGQGIALVAIGGVVSIVAYRLMVRIGRLPEPRRWFG